MAQVEREKIVYFEFASKMLDVGVYKTKLKLRRRTAQLSTEIKMAKARMLGGFKAASLADDLHFDVMATLANGVEPVPNPTPNDSTAWIEDILDPAIWYGLYDRWQEYQNSFLEAPKAEAGSAAGGEATI